MPNHSLNHSPTPLDRIARAAILATLCVTGAVSCAQPIREHQTTAVTSPQVMPALDSVPPRARLDDRWSSALIGMPVANTNGETLGRVYEVIVDGYGHPGFAIVRYGARVPGLNAKYTAIPWKTVADILDRDRLSVDRVTLENAPALANPGARDGEWRSDAERYWRGKVASAQ